MVACDVWWFHRRSLPSHAPRRRRSAAIPPCGLISRWQVASMTAHMNHSAASQTCSHWRSSARPSIVPLFSSRKLYFVDHLSLSSRTFSTFSRLSMHFEWISAGRWSSRRLCADDKLSSCRRLITGRPASLGLVITQTTWSAADVARWGDAALKCIAVVGSRPLIGWILAVCSLLQRLLLILSVWPLPQQLVLPVMAIAPRHTAHLGIGSVKGYCMSLSLLETSSRRWKKPRVWLLSVILLYSTTLQRSKRSLTTALVHHWQHQHRRLVARETTVSLHITARVARNCLTRTISCDAGEVNGLESLVL